MNYLIYKTSTGEVASYGSVPDEAHYNMVSVPANHTIMQEDSPDPANYYYPSGVKTARPVFTSVASWNKQAIDGNGTDSATFGSSLPNPTTVKAIRMGSTTETSTTVTNGTFTFTATVSGTYRIHVEAFPYKPYWATITVNAGLTEAQLNQWKLIKRDRDIAVASGFTYDTNNYQSDPVSVVNIIGVALAAKIKKDNSETFSVDWTTSDNTVVTLDADGAIALGLACMSHVSAQYDTGVVLREDIEAATTISEVESVVWPT